MMKMKKLTALLMSGALVLGLAACGPKEEKKQSPAEQLGAAVAKLNEVKSVNATSTVNMEMTVAEQKVAMNMKMDMTTFNDPVKMHCGMEMSMAGQNGGKMDIYVQQDGDKYLMYLFDGAQWAADEIELGEAAKFDAQQSIDLYTKSMQDLKVTEEDKAIRYDGVLKGDAVEEAVKNSGALNQMGAEVDPEMMKTMFEGLGDLPISVWVDKESGFPTHYYMDMTALMDGMMQKMMSTMGEEAAQLGFTVEKMEIDVEYSDFDAAADFEIPADALDAAA